MIVVESVGLHGLQPLRSRHPSPVFCAFIVTDATKHHTGQSFLYKRGSIPIRRNQIRQNPFCRNPFRRILKKYIAWVNAVLWKKLYSVSSITFLAGTLSYC